MPATSRNPIRRACIRALAAKRQISAQIARFELGEIAAVRFGAEMIGEETEKRRHVALIGRNGIGRETPLVADVGDPLGEKGGG